MAIERWASLAAKTASTTPRMDFDLEVLRLFGVDLGVEHALWHNLATHHPVAAWATVHSGPPTACCSTCHEVCRRRTHPTCG